MIPEMSTALRSSRAFAYENPRPDVQALVPRGARRILDLGCSSGAVGAALKARQGAEVVGLELDAGYAADAALRLDRVVQGDLEELATREDLAADLGRFDCLVAADVLEHLRDPWTVLARFAELLEAGGAAVVSLPNVRYWDTFWQIGWKGSWPRRHEGIFDATHLRWFTLWDAYELLRAAGLEPGAVSRQMRFAPQGTRWDRHARRLERTPLRPFLTFQHVIAARRAGAA
jgi:methionine biosynthesis protein MetW